MAVYGIIVLTTALLAGIFIPNRQKERPHVSIYPRLENSDQEYRETLAYACYIPYCDEESGDA